MQKSSHENFKACLPDRFIAGILFVSLILLILPAASAQNNTLYLMHSIPQANQLNPALMHPCRFYLSLPVISSVRQSARNTGFGFHDVFYSGSGDKSDEYFVDMNKLDKTMRRMNYALSNTDVDLLGFGFPLKELYMTFGISSHASFQGSYPHDIVLLQDGNWDATTGTATPVNINNLEANSTAWNSISLSVSKEVSKGLRAGVRLKYLNGMANISTRTAAAGLNTMADPPSLNADINYRINSSVPLDLSFNPDGLLDNIGFDPALHNLAGNYILTGNHGLAIDAGITYDIDNATQISASFTDLGFIRWKDNITYFSVDETFAFSQADLDRFNSDPRQDDLFTALRDSLRNSIHASPSTNSYSTATPFNFYGGITRQLLPNLKAGAMTWFEINSGAVRPSLTLSLNLTPFKAFAATLSYTLMNNKANQIGAGLAFGTRGAQFYVLTDNIVVRYVKESESSLVWPYNARMLTLRFGLNLFFGCDKKENNKTTSSGSIHRSPKSKSRDVCPAYW